MYKTAPNGWLLCNGNEVSRSAYPRLYALIGDKYGTASSTNFFKLPNLVGRFLEGASENIGDLVEQGLPNITGNWKLNNVGACYGGASFDGCFKNSTNASREMAGGSWTNTSINSINFNAGNSNSIYGNSTKVQPNSIKVSYIIKY